MSKIFSLDLASIQSGWSIHDEKENLLSYGIIKPKPRKLTADERLLVIHHEIEEIIKRESPSQAILENPAGGPDKDGGRGPMGNWTTMGVLFMCQGVARLSFQFHEIPYEIISPSTWQNRLGFFKKYRDDRKAAARNYVVEKYKLSPDLEQDIYDAICLHDCWVYMRDWKNKSESNEVSAF
ncbi:hypothetical protein [Massilibacteroides sp.]|uniref:hypothetical protein n=1 Tax=Massilibacteroides sp. TaxID=2034766 RepID=UPI00262275A6|nr:hypothetical protein [Massilibacteroides sp.]MDD4516360.1 hypothetical protein [Massilibacteroides sp.]